MGSLFSQSKNTDQFHENSHEEIPKLEPWFARINESYNDKGKLHGERKEWYENGNLRSRSLYRNGKRHGKHEEWYEVGNLYKQMSYENGNPDKEFKTWDRDGRLQIHAFYLNGKLEGTYKFWGGEWVTATGIYELTRWTEDGPKNGILFYKHGKWNGESVFRNEENIIEEHSYWNNNILVDYEFNMKKKRLFVKIKINLYFRSHIHLDNFLISDLKLI